jgi:hypothetical protein
VTKIEKNMLKCHVERMDERRLTKEIYEAHVGGRRIMLEGEDLGEHFLTKLGNFREGSGQEYPKPASVCEEFDDS